MRVLITNNSLRYRAGSELYVRDVALALLRRGHHPVAFSTQLGPFADALRRATVPVVGDLAQLAEPPDVIHGHHHLETMLALLHFPGVPALGFCHGFLPWEELPARFPRVLRYVAVDETCRDRLVAENGIPPERVELLLNFVDLDRFRPRGPLPERPQRALLFSNGASQWTHLPAVREACRRAGISLDVIGFNSGNPAERPEDVLPGYDVVFAKARAALEAMATGAAVVVCDVSGLAGLVTPDNLDRLRRLNFGVRSLQRPVEVESLLAELAGYHAEKSQAVSQQIRSSASLEPVMDRLLSLYAAVIDEYRGREHSTDADAEYRAAAGYLGRIAPTLKDSYRVAQELAVLGVANTRLQAELDGAGRDRDREAAEHARSSAALLAERGRADALEQELARTQQAAAQAEAGRTAALAALQSKVGALEQARQMGVEAQAARSEAVRELAWIRGTLSWRVRGAALKLPGLAWLYRQWRGGID